MSANNWMRCPRCVKEAGESKTAEMRKADESYGKVSKTEYLSLLNKATEPIRLSETLREDWEIGMREDGTFEDGTFFVDYRCKCTKCGFEYSFIQEDKVSL